MTAFYARACNRCGLMYMAQVASAWSNVCRVRHCKGDIVPIGPNATPADELPAPGRSLSWWDRMRRAAVTTR